MLTQNEINALSLSPTKKDFVQIWNELLDVAGKLSERWDPTSTNESDPGIVILKALVGIADKLNYNIDKNTLEAFMPTAAQEDSMRKLCDMLGYNIKYYQSATTVIKVKYHPSEDDAEVKLTLPKFTAVTNSDQDVNYFIINDPDGIYPASAVIKADAPSHTFLCMEGQLVKCESINDNNVITANQISENNRFYLPETQIAENGIFVHNIYNNSELGGSGLEDGIKWDKVDNLNVQQRGSRVYKFGFDSYEGRPYIEFPEDYSELFSDGLFIYYTRTSGASGNISARTLTRLELPTTEDWSKVSAESFSVENTFAATNGSDIETIKQAYSNFKKTIGTFETLVTCRDYMNKIYLMTNSLGKPLVSNVLVTDIRNDLNRAVTICSCNNAGIFYKESALFSDEPLSEITKPVFNGVDADGDSKWHLGTEDGLRLTNFILDSDYTFDALSSGEVVAADGYWEIIQDGHTFKTNLSIGPTKPNIDHFDLVLYPFKYYNQIKNGVKDIRSVYDASFSYNPSAVDIIETNLKTGTLKTIAHNIVGPRETDLVSINNYLRLNATIATNSKITVEEGSIIIDKIKIALANAFNMRELDFGEAIPFDSIVEVIENADSRIKLVSLNEPTLYTTFSRFEGYENTLPVIREYAVKSEWLSEEAADATGRLDTTKDENGAYTKTFNSEEARKIYNKLAVRNVLAGRVPLFNYNNTFTTNFSEGAYQVTEEAEEYPAELPTPKEDNPFTIYIHEGKTYTGQYINGEAHYTVTYTPEKYKDNIITVVENNTITGITTSCEIFADDNNTISNVTLANNEFIKFRAPNFTTVKTYPAYVNYHLALNREILEEPINAKANALFDILNTDRTSWSIDNPNIRWQKVLDYFKNTSYKKTFTLTKKISPKAANTKGSLQDDTIIITIDNNIQDNSGIERAFDLFNKSGCIKLTSDYSDSDKGYRATITWDTSDGSTPPSAAPNIPIVLAIDNPFITNLDEIIKAIDAELAKQESVLPTDHAWTLSFDFECVPFEAASLRAWESFIKSSNKQALIGFTPETDGETLFWRTTGEGYATGKYILSSTQKLLRFESTHFGSLGTDIPLTKVYLVETLGKDSKPAIVMNNEEYMLKPGEYLYIEYTPSTTAEDGTTQEMEAVTEVYESGTIIRPSGFETGLMDSTVYASLGNSPHKTVTFDKPNSAQIGMQRFGAKEQVEIRDFSKVELTKNSFRNSAAVYIYKNFNGCTELENPEGNNGQRSYTLKDGEYIFYTDQNKAELAYFTTGTQVTLEGNIVLSQYDVIDLSTIFDLGISEIPWGNRVSFSSGDKIIFQEYQYITLGPEDTLENISLKTKNFLDSDWQYCDDVEYRLAGSKDTKSLPAVNIYTDNVDESKGNGWEVVSTLDLDVARNNTQTLRKTDKVQTGITLIGTSSSGDKSESIDLAPEKGKPSISFKTNLNCQSSSGQINIEDIYSNPNNLKGFEFKIFMTDEPTIVKTVPGKVIPFIQSGSTDVFDIADWPGDSSLVIDYSELWQSVSLKEIQVGGSADEADSALRLSVSILPNTYGIFSIYLDQTKSTAKTWIEVLPGTDRRDITLLNVPEDDIDKVWENAEQDNASDKLCLRPGINCIRVNKTGKLFIKTSNDAQGTLYFDDLKLINCLPIGDSDSALPLATYGLNLTQIGYLNPKDTVILDEADYKKFKAGYIDKALNKLTKLNKEKEEEFVPLHNEILKAKPQLKRIVDFIDKVKEEITLVINADDNSKEAFPNLLSQYATLSNELSKETALLKALDNNKNITTLEQQLVDLLNSFSSIEGSQQQLLDELETLKVKIATEIATLSKKAIVDDFNKNAIIDTTGELKDELVAASNKLVEAAYNEQLVQIVEDIEKVANSDERARLLNAFNALKQNAAADNQAILVTKVKQLAEAANRTELDSLLELMQTAANEVDYKTLHVTLLKLQDFIGSKDFESLAVEIEAAVSAGGSKEALNGLISDLKALIVTYQEETNSEKASGGEDGSVISKINALLDLVQNNIDSATAIPDISTGVANVYKSVTTEYIARLTNLLTETEEILEALESDYEVYDKAITSLQASKDTQVTEILNRLKNITADRKSALDKISVFIVQSNINNLPNPNETAYIVWSNRVAVELNTELETFYLDSFNSISNAQSTEVDLSDSRLNDFTELDLEALTLLQAQINSLAQKGNQNDSRAELINTISGLLPVSSDLELAMGAFTASNENNKTAIIRSLIQALQNNGKTAAEKQSLIKTLREELDSNIIIDKELVRITANLICPSLLLYEQEFPTTTTESIDPFYENLVDLLQSSRDNLLKDTSRYAETLEQIEKAFKEYEDTDFELSAALEAQDLSRLKTWLCSDWFNTQQSGQSFLFNSSLLPQSYLKVLEGLSKIAQVQQEIENTKQHISNIVSIEDIFVHNEKIYEILVSLVNDFDKLNANTFLESNDDLKNAYNFYLAERRLLEDIRKIDRDRDFYYTSSVDSNLAIEFNESDTALNTLMNPATNYDINNINNPFVISKLDINYLDQGLQIARSSRLN